jgi:enamine deaminase RidA (YjgF/YER057c/UK114 family)
MKRLNPSGLTRRFSDVIAQITVAPAGARLAAISGQVALDAAETLVGPANHAAQARQCFANISTALTALDAGARDILQMRIHVVRHSPDLVPAIFGAGREVFGDEWPVCASTWIGVEALGAPEWLVEVDALVAVQPCHSGAWG